MNLLKNTKRVAAVTLLIATAASAQVRPLLAEGGHVGGGDGECENRIHSVRRDLLRWVTENKFQDLQLQYGIERNEYVSLMQNILKDNAVDVSCTHEKVTVAGSEKTCRNITEINGKRSIECNFNAIIQSSEAGVYRTVHHEFASLVQVELSVGANSDYFVSDQIQDYPEKVMTLKMGIKKQKEESKVKTPPTFKSKGCYTGRARFSQSDVNKIAQENAQYKCLAKGYHDAVLLKTLPYWDHIGCLKGKYTCE